MTTLPKLELVDQNVSMARALSMAFDSHNVLVRCGSLLKSQADTLLCPANSFGDMGGGLDRAIDLHFDRQAQPRLQAAIAEYAFGELPVGTALIIPVKKGRIRHLIAAPTMRVPGNVSKTLNAYLAFRAALVAAIQHNQKARRRLAISPLLASARA